jgi:hypothetical protein
MLQDESRSLQNDECINVAVKQIGLSMAHVVQSTIKGN